VNFIRAWLCSRPIPEECRNDATEEAGRWRRLGDENLTLNILLSRRKIMATPSSYPPFMPGTVHGAVNPNNATTDGAEPSAPLDMVIFGSGLNSDNPVAALASAQTQRILNRGTVGNAIPSVSPSVRQREFDNHVTSATDVPQMNQGNFPTPPTEKIQTQEDRQHKAAILSAGFASAGAGFALTPAAPAAIPLAGLSAYIGTMGDKAIDPQEPPSKPDPYVEAPSLIN
jgi:hypothetical protein